MQILLNTEGLFWAVTQLWNQVVRVRLCQSRPGEFWESSSRNGGIRGICVTYCWWSWWASGWSVPRIRQIFTKFYIDHIVLESAIIGVLKLWVKFMPVQLVFCWSLVSILLFKSNCREFHKTLEELESFFFFKNVIWNQYAGWLMTR